MNFLDLIADHTIISLYWETIYIEGPKPAKPETN